MKRMNPIWWMMTLLCRFCQENNAMDGYTTCKECLLDIKEREYAESR